MRIFVFLHISKPKSFTPFNLDNETIKDEATNPSIIPVGTYHISIEGTVTTIPPRVPTIGNRPISIPTANAVQTLEMNEATNMPNANRFVVNPLERKVFTIKKDITPITAMLKMFAPKVVIPPSPIAAWITSVMVMLIKPAKGPKTIETAVPPKKCHVLPPPATGNSNN